MSTGVGLDTLGMHAGAPATAPAPWLAPPRALRSSIAPRGFLALSSPDAALPPSVKGSRHQPPREQGGPGCTARQVATCDAMVACASAMATSFSAALPLSSATRCSFSRRDLKAADNSSSVLWSPHGSQTARQPASTSPPHCITPQPPPATTRSHTHWLCFWMSSLVASPCSWCALHGTTHGK